MKKLFFAFCFFILSFSIFCEEVTSQEFINILRYDKVSNIKKYTNTFISSLTVFSDNTIELFSYGGERLYLNPIDTNNQTFYITDEESTTEYYAYRNSKTFCLFKGDIANKEKDPENTHKIINHIYSGNIWGDPNLKIKIGEDSVLYFFENGEWKKEGYVNSFDEDSKLSFIVSNNTPYPIYVGFFSSDGEQLYIGFGDCFIDKKLVSGLSQYINPKLTINSVKIGPIDFNSSPNDLLLFFPTCRTEEDEYIKDYIVEDYSLYDSITFSFYDNKLISILEEKTGYSNKYNDEVTSSVQRLVNALIELYGIPEIFENTFDYSKYSEEHYYSYHITRTYTWNGELGVKLTYEYYDRYGTVYNPSCEILYTLDSFDLAN